MWRLIDNDAQQIREFGTLRELREYAKKYNLEIKRSSMNYHVYYSEAEVIL